MKKLLLLLSLFPVILLKAQVSAYSFAQTTSVYTPITGGTIVATATANTAAGSVNDAIFNLPAGSFPFTFVYNGTGYTGCNISSNGFITFGATAPAGTLYTPISGTTGYAGAISAWGGDLNSVFSLGTASVTGQIRVETVGTAPDREFVIQWSNWRPANSVSITNANVMNFQIRLEESSNKISVTYGSNSYLIGSTAITGTRQIGLRGATNADFKNRSNASTVLFTSSVNGGANTATQTFSTTGSIPAMPANGLTYMWQALTPCSGTPDAGDAVCSHSLLCSPTTVTLNLLNSTTGSNNLNYQWQSSPNGSTWTSIPSATTIAITRSVSATTYFQCIVACGSSSATSTPVVVTYGAPVSGGTAISSSTLLCTAGQTVALSLPGSSTFPEVNYQWQSSPNGSSWTSVPSATLSSLNPTINASTYYQAIVSCGANTASATPVQVVISSVITNTIPYSESFEDITMNDQLPNCSWKASDLPTTCKTYTAATGSYNQYAKTGTKFASFNYNTNPAGDYFYSNGLQLTAGINYIASVDYITDGANGWSEFKLLYGTTQSTTGLTPIIGVTGAITNTVYVNASGTFSVPSTGIYYIAVKAIGDTNPWYLTFDDLKVSVAPPCTLTPVAGTITGPSTVLSGTSNSFTLAPATGTIQWYSSSSSTGPWTVIGGASAAIGQAITSTGSGNIYYTAVASIPGCINDTANLPFNVNINFPGDNVCNAIPLSIGTSGYYKPYGATVQSGEVVPPGTSCTSNKSWCNTTLNNSMWFSFVAPASGYVSVQAPSSLNGGNNDSKLALWSAPSCTALLSTSTATLLAANDDDASYTSHSGAQYSSYIRAACLTPGATYYIQFDTSADATPDDSTRIIITNLGTLNTSFTGLAANYCLPTGNSVLTPATSGGVFTLNTNTTTITSFNPTTAGVGTHTVNYSIYGCKSSSTTVVSNAPTLTATTSNSFICSGSSATLTAGGAINYTWSPISIMTASTVVSPTTSVTYTLTGSNGTCASTKTVSISVSTTPTISATSSNSTICSGSSATLTASGATAYTWTPGSITSATAVVTPTNSTTYTVTGKNGTCSSTNTIAVTVSSSLSLSATASSGSICTGSSATLTAGGATNYTWMPGNITSSVAVVSPTVNTTYTLTGLSGSCSGTTTILVNVSSDLTVSASTTSSTLCAGASATLTGSGATSYTWNPGNITTANAIVSPTSTTTYTVIGLSGICTGTNTVLVTVNSNPVVTASTSASAICSGSSVTLTASGATNYTWAPVGLTSGTAVVTPTTTTVYTVTSASGLCSGTTTVSVAVSNSPTLGIASSATAICSGSTITFTASGATSYTWMPGAATTTVVAVTPTIASTYTLSGKTGICSSTKTITINVTTTPTVTATRSSSVICSGTSATLTATGATNYTWTPGSITSSVAVVSPTSTTTYSVIGKNGSCSNTKTISINVAASPTVNAVGSNTSICSGASSTLTASGATSYTWMPGSMTSTIVTVTPSLSTTYTLTGKSGSCSNTKTISVNVTASPTVMATASNSNICSGTQLTLSANGATNYTWMPGSITSSITNVTPTTSTTYTVTGANGNCITTKTVLVNVTPTPTINATASNSSICSGQASTLTVTGAVNYTWNPGNMTSDIVSVTPLVTTTYTVTGSSGNCSDIKTVSVNVTSSPTVNAVSSGSLICSGTSATLTTGGATSYTWSSSANTSDTEIVSPLTNTTYTVTGSNGNCSDSKTLNIGVAANPTVIASASPSVICEGSSVTLSAGGAVNYTWAPVAAATATLSDIPSSSTIYTVTGDDGLCTATATVNVSVTPNPTVSLTASSLSVCAASTVTLTAGGATSYTWSSSANTSDTEIVSPLTTTSYSVTGENNGCFGSKSIAITITSNPTLTVNSNSIICAGSSATLTAGGASTYSWMPTGGTTDTEIVTPLSSAMYTVTGWNGNCSSTATVAIDVNPLPTVSATASQTLLCDDGSTGSSILTAVSTATNYLWSDGTTSMSTAVTPTVTSTYTVTVDDGLCSTEAYVTVNVSNCTGVKEFKEDVITLFPNPNSGYVIVTLKDDAMRGGYLELYDALGKLVMKELLNEEKVVIKTNTLEEGIYMYKVIHKGQILKTGRMIRN